MNLLRRLVILVHAVHHGASGCSDRSFPLLLFPGLCKTGSLCLPRSLVTQTPCEYYPLRLYAIVPCFFLLFFCPSVFVFMASTESRRRCGTSSLAPARPCRRTAWPSSGTRLDRMLCSSRTLASTRTASPAPPGRVRVVFVAVRVVVEDGEYCVLRDGGDEYQQC